MQENNAIQQEGARLPEGRAAAHAESETALKNKVEALRELVLVLLERVESLGESPALRGHSELDFSEEVHHFEAELIRNALIRTGGRQRRAARLLKMKLTTFHSKVKRYQLDSDELVKGASALRGHYKGTVLKDGF